jgi:hypothetical protein
MDADRLCQPRRLCLKEPIRREAGYGFCPSKSRFYWGMRLVLVTDQIGVPLGYDLVAPAEGEREPLFRLAHAHPGTVLFADKGFWGLSMSARWSSSRLS